MKRLNIFIFTVVSLFVLNTGAFAQDRNFYIFICFGQSNMQGAAPIESQDKTINDWFKVFQAQDCPYLNHYYTFIPREFIKDITFGNFTELEDDKKLKKYN